VDNPDLIVGLDWGITEFDIFGNQPKDYISSGVHFCCLVKSANSGGRIGYVPSLSLNKN
jgi:hypothetical protein